ncbi:unannotated protein [freshwater metagenome]|uniref:Unannotated protein n=1 Tax=freshwater metagenome TaxID=449393 RepID=A0A6J7AQ06_9ZZZZ
MDSDAQHTRTWLAHLRRGRHPIFELDPLPQTAHCALPGGALDLGQVFLLDTMAGVCQPMREIAIVGHQQQTFGALIEASHWVHPRFLRHQLHDGGPTLRVVRGGHHTLGFVEQVIHEPRFEANRHTIHFNGVVFGVHSAAEHGDLTIHRDAVGADHVLADTTAPPAAHRQHLLQPLTLGQLGRLRRPLLPQRRLHHSRMVVAVGHLRTAARPAGRSADHTRALPRHRPTARTPRSGEGRPGC